MHKQYYLHLRKIILVIETKLYTLETDREALKLRIIQVRIKLMVETVNMIEITYTQNAILGQNSVKENFRKEQLKVEGII